MKTGLVLKCESLFNQSSLYQVPHDAQRLSRIKDLFKTWTEDSKNPIYSGYRQSILKAEGLEESLSLAQEWRKSFDTLIVLGIGGSALGARAILNALEHTIDSAKKVLILDNLDPVVFEKSLEGLNLAKTGVALITKSGGTLETMAQASELLERYSAAQVDYKKNWVCITDPQDGTLRSWVNKEKLQNLSVPPSVGGRFSALSPVGIFPLAFAGVDVKALIQGAQAQFHGKLIPEADLFKFGLRLVELENEGFKAHVLMPYASVLKDLSAWFVQLWGESLGKKSLDNRRTGPVPVAAVGATDQHSILQLLVEGPLQVISGFINIDDWNFAQNPQMKALPHEFAKLSFAEKFSFGKILRAQSQATQTVLNELQRPTYNLEITQLNAFNIGALLAFYMDLTSVAGAAHEVNPYDQPGVELGKKILPQFLGQS